MPSHERRTPWSLDHPGGSHHAPWSAAAVVSILCAGSVAVGCAPKRRKPRLQKVVLDSPAPRKSTAAQPRQPGTAPRRNAARPGTGSAREAGRPGVVLVTRGVQPTHTLRYRVPAGTKAQYRASVWQVTNAPEPIGSFESKYVYELVLNVERDPAVKPDGAATPPRPHRGPAGPRPRPGARPAPEPLRLVYSIRNLQVTLPKRLGVNQELLARRLAKRRFAIRLDPRGRILGYELLGPDNGKAGAAGPGRPSPARTWQSLAGLQPVLPKEPVGVGARWKVTYRLHELTGGTPILAQLDTTIAVRYELAAWKETPHGKAAELKLALDMEGSSKTGAQTVTSRGSGTGRILLLLSTGLVETAGTRVEVSATVQGAQSKNVTKFQASLLSVVPPFP